MWDEVLHTAHEVSGSASVLLQAATAPSAADVANAVWDEVLHTDHEVASSASVLLQAAGGAADPLLNAVPGAYAAGTAGYVLGTNLTAPVDTIDTVVDAIKVVTDQVAGMLETDGLVKRYTVNALENAPSGTGASAATIAAAVWEEALSGHTTAGTAGHAVTDAADPTIVVKADIEQINGVTIVGDGSTIPWGPA